MIKKRVPSQPVRVTIAMVLLLCISFTGGVKAQRQSDQRQGDVFNRNSQDQQSGDQFFIVVGITQMSGDAYDVKLKNPRTGYIHSITVYIDIIIGIKIGDWVKERREGGRVLLVRLGNEPTSTLPPKDNGIAYYNLTLGVVCWIDSKDLPFVRPDDAIYATLAWWNKVTIGLVATSNPEPPVEIKDLDRFRKLKQYRGLLWCKLRVGIDKQTDRVISCQIYDKVIDPGWTPPFDKTKVAFGPAMFNIPDDPNFYEGEKSPLSEIYSLQRHPNSALGPLPTNEELLVNGLLKFRAGSHTDQIGIRDANSPYHVPWVWTEMALTYAKNGQFCVYRQGSVFPSHAWYFNGQSVSLVLQKKLNMNDKEIAFITGAPASGPQQKDDQPPTVPMVYGHRFTLSAGSRGKNCL